MTQVELLQNLSEIEDMTQVFELMLFVENYLNLKYVPLCEITFMKLEIYIK